MTPKAIARKIHTVRNRSSSPSRFGLAFGQVGVLLVEVAVVISMNPF